MRVQPSVNYKLLSGIVLSATAFIFFARLGAAPVYILDEAKNAQCAREMWLSDNWLVPTFNGVLRTDKPPLHYWFMCISFSLFGVGEWQARLFSALCGLGTIAAVFRFVKARLGIKSAFFAMLPLCLSTHFLFEFRLAVPDPYLIFFTTLGLLASYNYLQKPTLQGILLTAVWLALAALAKGPVALALPGLIVLIYIMVFRAWHVLRPGWIMLAALVFVAIASPWYILVHKATGGAFSEGFFLEHNLNRFSSEKEGHGGFFLLTPVMVFVGMLPFSLFMFGPVGAKRSFFKQPLAAYCGIAVLVYVAFFSVSSTKLPNYPMPCYPMLSIVIGLWLAQHIQPSGKVPWYFWAVVLVVAMALPVGAYVALTLEELTRPLAPLAWSILVLPLGIAASLVLYLRMRLAKAAIMFVISYALFNFLALDVLYPQVYRQNIVSWVLETIRPAQAEFVAYKLYNPAFNFNLPAEKCFIPVYNHPDSLRAGLAARQSKGASGTLYIISRQESIGQLDTVRYDSVIAGKDIFELPTTILLKWRP